MRASGSRWVWVVTMLGIAACAPESAFELPDEVAFGDGALGVELTRAVVVRNVSKVDDVLELSTDVGFDVAPAKFELEAGAEAELTVRFTPTALGPREGVLKVRSVHAPVKEVRLTARGVGPALEVESSVALPPLALLFGQTAVEGRAVLHLRNVGTQNSLLQLEVPEASGPDLCIGEFLGDACVQWLPRGIPAGALVEVPLSLRAVDAGARAWVVTLRSNDPRAPTRTVNVYAGVERVEPCQFGTPPLITLSQSLGLVTLTHAGNQRCLVQAMELDATPADSVRFDSPVSFPRLLHPGESLTRGLRVVALAEFFAGTLTVRAAGTAPLEIPLQPADGANACVVVTPASLDFGTTREGCAGATRLVGVYNVCPRRLRLSAVSLAGESADFALVSAQLDTDIVAGGPPAWVGVRFAPTSIGAKSAALVLRTSPATQRIVALTGVGDGVAFATDTFRQDAPVRVDVAFVVDTSPSFAPRRAAVRAQLDALLTNVANACTDVQVAFAPAEGAAPVAFAPNDAGSQWTSSLQPDFVARSLSAFDALPPSSETEACVGVVEQLVGSTRPNVNQVSGVCITDALEQTPDAGGAFAAVQARVPRLSWSAVTGLPSSTCAVEARDDDQVHRTLAGAGFGSAVDVCRSDWAAEFTTANDCGARTQFFLNARALPPIEVRVDGQPVTSGWTYEPANNGIHFDPSAAPPPGSTLEVSYALACTP